MKEEAGLKTVDPSGNGSEQARREKIAGNGFLEKRSKQKDDTVHHKKSEKVSGDGVSEKKSRKNNDFTCDNVEDKNFCGKISRKKLKEDGFSSHSFPFHTIKRILKSDANFRTSHDAAFLINKASVLFLELFVKDAYSCATKAHRKTISYQNLATTVSKGKRYEFLSDFVPEKLRGEDALSRLTLSKLDRDPS